mmetsp:Transcript_24061/g.47234  ORF Transcript_24061/g.47234 Transcript_24061/m.47234 type:complete len:98 (+) Transcript_24061:3870-4163(+)
MKSPRRQQVSERDRRMQTARRGLTSGRTSLSSSSSAVSNSLQNQSRTRLNTVTAVSSSFDGKKENQMEKEDTEKTCNQFPCIPSQNFILLCKVREKH